MSTSVEALARPAGEWPIHSMSRPQPVVVRPAPSAPAAGPPSDAVVLFDGSSLEHWRSASDTGTRAGWTVRDGYMEVAPGTGNIVSRQAFGDVQLHLAWATPAPAHGDGQARGNSGVFLMRLYEIQVLDSYENPTYADGAAGAIYGQFPPLVNPSRPPGEWQTYDIIFHAPRFDGDGRLLLPARMTILYNGVLVQDDVALTGPTAHQHRPPYATHPDRLPLELQDHGNLVRYRNIWIREL
ncbi:MAG TPA: DUF1080 domain-containing protein [Gemmatimonadaceae bacterium]|nr:DUF1080 domain-containing protein [Gemmatimonadaceae bacterium]